ncbi:ATP-binding cassette domain-containing protein [Actinacidiphila sp. DG2A-62]|uniref:ATP-binding cassette domain-containing protein n=1 Tax=Actinacidiphila sp. DG2A-62 TaxID=3108821 RepID=UPI002DBC203C|nr:ATP-binding cassette domain-containing protein [Actinacidiphila sp. DG2A-62]MEC3997580.1 ATP-binding cassette domain-containing protein [Actinacidiphila sp. DG2A-62]
MIQAIGLTSTPRRDAGPAVADLTFDIRAGEVTGLLGPAGAGKTAAVRLLLGVDDGRGATLVHGRPLSELPHPEREIGALIGDVPAHPRRSARGHLRMLCAAFGLPASRADDLLDLVGLDAVADEPIGSYSLGMDRRLGFAVALLARPRVLVLDDPVRGLPPPEAAWVHELARRHAAAGGAVLLTGRDPRALARTADRMLVLADGRLVADVSAAHFARTRLRPYVAVRSPYASRLGDVLAEGGAEVVPAGGGRIAVYGASSAVVGEAAYRHGILLHQLADRVPGDESTAAPAAPAAPTAPPARAAHPTAPTHPTAPAHPAATTPAGPHPPTAAGPGTAVAPNSSTPPGRAGLPDGLTRATETTDAAAPGADARPPASRTSVTRLPESGRLRTGPARPLRYELRRALGIRTPWLTAAAALLGSAAGTVLMARYGALPAGRLALLSGWSPELPLPAAAIGAGGLGALSYGQEYLHPALTPGYGPEPRHPGLLAAKLAVSAALALVLAALAVVVDVALMRTSLAAVPTGAPDPFADPGTLAAWGGLAVGCAWAGVLAAAAFRTTGLGLAAVLAVPLLAVPAVRALLHAHVGRELLDAAGALWSLASGVPQGGDAELPAALRFAAQPLVLALALCLAVLMGAYTASTLRGRRRGRRPTPAPGTAAAPLTSKKG